jgi:hypothetical protein
MILFYLGIFIVVAFIAIIWTNGIDYMQKNHPDYKGLDLFDEEDKDEVL